MVSRVIGLIAKLVLIVFLVFCFIAFGIPFIDPASGFFDEISLIDKPKAPPVIEPELLFSANDIEIHSVELVTGKEMGLTMEIKNSSVERKIVQLDNIVLNRWGISSNMLLDLKPMETKMETLVFPKTDLDACRISRAASIRFDVSILSPLDESILHSEEILVKTTAENKYIYAFNTTGEDVFVGNNLLIKSRSLVQNTKGEGALQLFLQNDYPDNLTLSIESMRVNGQDITFGYNVQIPHNSYQIATIPIADTKTSTAYKADNIKLLSISFSVINPISNTIIVQEKTVQVVDTLPTPNFSFPESEKENTPSAEERSLLAGCFLV